MACLALAAAMGLQPATEADAAPPWGSNIESRKLAGEILTDPDLSLVLDKARALLKTGLTAGSGYGEVWIRDLNTFIELSLEVNPHADIRAALLNFFKFQEPNGDVPDGYIPKERASVGYKYRRSPLAPELLAHKNTVETDQETSLVQAVRRFVTVTGDRSLLAESVAGKSVLDRLELALGYLLKDRFDGGRGLVWGATTADWGDVQPEHAWGVELDASSHRAIDIYDNAMFVVAVEDLLQLLGRDSPRADRWRKVRDDVKRNVRKHLWDEARQKFVPHVYLDGSPFPKDFDEAAIYYHGGTTVAIEAGLLTRDEIARSLAAMRANVKAAGALSIALTMYPPYPKGYFKNTGMGPYSYQNGGDWCWFGGRMIQQLVRHGFVREAYDELKPMIARARKHGDFHEWWSLDNQPRGSKQYRGSAGVLGKAILMLRAGAEEQQANPGGEKKL
jgi:cellobiose phosphorylase